MQPQSGAECERIARRKVCTAGERAFRGASLLPLSVLLATIGSALAGLAQEPTGDPGVEAPSQMQRLLDTPQPLEAEEDEVDAEKAQAEKAEREGAAGARLSPGEARRIEEIVVHARRRAELLEDTP